MSTVKATSSPGATSCGSAVLAPSHTTAFEPMSNQWYPRWTGWSPPAGQGGRPVFLRCAPGVTTPAGAIDAGAVVAPHVAPRCDRTRSGKALWGGAGHENQARAPRMGAGV